MSSSEAQDPVERRHRDWGGGAHNVLGFQVLRKCLFSLSAFVQGLFLIVVSYKNQSTINGLSASWNVFWSWSSHFPFNRVTWSSIGVLLSLPFIWSDFLVGGQVSDPIGKKTSGAQIFFQFIRPYLFWEKIDVNKIFVIISPFFVFLVVHLQTFAVLFWISMYLFSGITFTAFLVVKEYLNSFITL